MRSYFLHILLPLVTFLFYLSSCRNTGEGEKQSSVAMESVDSSTREMMTFSNNYQVSDTGTVHKILEKGNALVDALPDSAIVFYLQALPLSRQLNYPEGMAALYNNLVYCYSRKGDIARKRYYMTLMQEVLPQVPSSWFNNSRKAHKRVMAQRYDQIATRAFASGNYDTATAALIKIMTLWEKSDSTTYTMIIKSYLGLGAIASRMENTARALFYFNQAEKIALQYRDSFFYTDVLTNKASLYLDRQSYDTARALALHALRLCEENNSQDEHGSFNANTVAVSYLRQDRPEEALPYSKKVLHYALNAGAEEQEISAYYVLGYNYVRLGQYQKAEGYLQTGLRMAEQSGMSDNIANAYGQLAAVYEGMGLFRKALQYEVKYAVTRDSLLSKESINRVAEIETRYRVERKDKELAQKDKVLLENKLKIASQQKQQYIWIGGTMFFILILLALLRHKYLNAEIIRLKATMKGEERERKRMAKELHDGIVNRLSILKMNFTSLPEQYTELRGANDFQDMILQLEQDIAELRDISHNLLPDILLRAGLEESLKVYCEKIRKTTPLDIEIQWIGTAPKLNDDFQLNIYRIIQELVGNIIKHSNANHALIQFNFHENSLDITIDDDGIGLRQDSFELHKGIGLQNLRDRIRLLNGSMNIERRKGTSVYLEFSI